MSCKFVIHVILRSLWFAGNCPYLLYSTCEFRLVILLLSMDMHDAVISPSGRSHHGLLDCPELDYLSMPMTQITLPTQEDALDCLGEDCESEGGEKEAIEPPRTRRRIRFKQPDPCGASRPQVDKSVPAKSMMSGPDPLKNDGLSKSDYNHFHYRFHRWLKSCSRGVSCEDSERALAQPFRTLDRGGRYEVVKKWAAEDGGAIPAVCARVVEFYRAQAQPVSKDTGVAGFRAPTLLLTWNGDWGLFRLEDGGGAWVSTKELCSRLSLSPAIGKLATSIRRRLEEWDRTFHCTDSAWSIELSVKRYEKAFAELQQSIARKVDQDPQATPGAPMGLESLSDEERELRRLPIRVHVHCFMRSAAYSASFFRKISSWKAASHVKVIWPSQRVVGSPPLAMVACTICSHRRLVASCLEEPLALMTLIW